ncbi:hypothetical protein ACSNOH_13245 [Streptomyces sp. URMC 127]|uniref:hypothetical protein n=1 Tax=Streptomyces sp. URMC 127 TaxID=3423402 RepID=UPI003F1BFD90
MPQLPITTERLALFGTLLATFGELHPLCDKLGAGVEDGDAQEAVRQGPGPRRRLPRYAGHHPPDHDHQRPRPPRRGLPAPRSRRGDIGFEAGDEHGSEYDDLTLVLPCDCGTGYLEHVVRSDGDLLIVINSHLTGDDRRCNAGLCRSPR